MLVIITLTYVIFSIGVSAGIVLIENFEKTEYDVSNMSVVLMFETMFYNPCYSIQCGNPHHDFYVMDEYGDYIMLRKYKVSRVFLISVMFMSSKTTPIHFDHGLRVHIYIYDHDHDLFYNEI